MVSELQYLRSFESRLREEINEISLDICNARTKLLSEEQRHNEFTDKFSTSSAELEVPFVISFILFCVGAHKFKTNLLDYKCRG